MSPAQRQPFLAKIALVHLAVPTAAHPCQRRERSCRRLVSGLSPACRLPRRRPRAGRPAASPAPARSGAAERRRRAMQRPASTCRYFGIIVLFPSLRPRERQVQQQVLRLQPQAVVRDPSPSPSIPAARRSPDASPPDRRIAARTGTAAAPVRSSSTSTPIVQIVEQRARLGVESDVPDPARIVDLALRRDGDVDRQEMRDPALQHAAQRGERGLAAIEADRQVEALVARPVGVGIVFATARRDRRFVPACGSAPAIRRGCRSRRSSRAARPSASSAAITAPSRHAIFWTRNSISAARASIGSASAPRMCRSRICVS